MFRSHLFFASLAGALVLANLHAAETTRFEQAPLREVLQQLERQTGHRLVYDEALLETAKPVTFTAPEGMIPDRVFEEVLREQGLVAIESPKGPWALVPMANLMGRAKATGAALRTFADLAKKLDDARVIGNDLRIPSWTAEDDRRLAYALTDFISIIAWHECVKRNRAMKNDGALSDLTRLLQCSDPDVRAGAFMGIALGSMLSGSHPEDELLALLRKELTDPDPLARSALLLALSKINGGQEIAHPYRNQAIQSPHACERFAAALSWAMRYKHWKPETAAAVDFPKNLPRLQADPSVAVRALSRYVQLQQNLRGRQGDAPTAIKTSLEGVSADKNPVLRTLLPGLFVLVVAEDYRYRGQPLALALPDLVPGDDGWARDCRDYLAGLETLLKDPTAPGLDQALAKTERLLQSKSPARQLLPVVALPYAMLYARTSTAERADPQKTRPINQRGKMKALMGLAMQRLAKPDNPLLQGSTIQAILKSESAWVRGLGISLGSFSGQLKELPGLMDTTALQQLELAFRRGLSSADELERAPACLAANLLVGNAFRRSPDKIPPEIRQAFQTSLQSRRLGENLLITQVWGRVLTFDESMAILHQRLQPGNPAVAGATWLAGMIPPVVWNRSEKDRRTQENTVIDAALATRSPEIEQALLNGLSIPVPGSVYGHLDPAVFVRLLEALSPVTLRILQIENLSFGHDRAVSAALRKRITALASSSAAGDQEAARSLAAQANAWLPWLHDGSPEQLETMDWMFALLTRQFLKAEKPGADAMAFLSAAIRWHCEKTSWPDLPQTILEATGIALSQASDPACHVALLDLARAFDDRLHCEWGHRHGDTETVRGVQKHLTDALLATGSVEVQVRLLMLLAEKDSKWATRLAERLMAGKVPESLRERAIQSTQSQAAALPSTYHEFLFNELTRDAPVWNWIPSAFNVLCSVPRWEERLVDAVLNLENLDYDKTHFLFHLILQSAMRTHPRPLDANLLWVRRIRDFASKTIQQQLAQSDFGGVLEFCHLLTDCGEDSEAEQILIKVIRSPDIQRDYSCSGRSILLTQAAASLASVAPRSNLYAQLLKKGYEDLPTPVLLGLGKAAARSPQAEAASTFLIKVLTDERVIGHLKEDRIAIMGLDRHLQLPASPELVAALQALAQRFPREDAPKWALKKLGVKPEPKPKRGAQLPPRPPREEEF